MISKSPPSSPLANHHEHDAMVEVRAQQQALLASLYAQLGVLGQTNGNEAIHELLSMFSQTASGGSDSFDFDKRPETQPITRQTAYNGKSIIVRSFFFSISYKMTIAKWIIAQNNFAKKKKLFFARNQKSEWG